MRTGCGCDFCSVTGVGVGVCVNVGVNGCALLDSVKV